MHGSSDSPGRESLDEGEVTQHVQVETSICAAEELEPNDQSGFAPLTEQELQSHDSALKERTKSPYLYSPSFISCTQIYCPAQGILKAGLSCNDVSVTDSDSSTYISDLEDGVHEAKSEDLNYTPRNAGVKEDEDEESAAAMLRAKVRSARALYRLAQQRARWFPQQRPEEKEQQEQERELIDALVLQQVKLMQEGSNEQQEIGVSQGVGEKGKFPVSSCGSEGVSPIPGAHSDADDAVSINSITQGQQYVHYTEDQSSSGSSRSLHSTSSLPMSHTEQTEQTEQMEQGHEVLTAAAAAAAADQDEDEQGATGFGRKTRRGTRRKRKARDTGVLLSTQMGPRAMITTAPAGSESSCDGNQSPPLAPVEALATTDSVTQETEAEQEEKKQAETSEQVHRQEKTGELSAAATYIANATPAISQVSRTPQVNTASQVQGTTEASAPVPVPVQAAPPSAGRVMYFSHEMITCLLHSRKQRGHFKNITTVLQCVSATRIIFFNFTAFDQQSLIFDFLCIDLY